MQKLCLIIGQVKDPGVGNTVLHKIIDFIKLMDISKWGLCNINGIHSLGDKYPTALSFLMEYPYISDAYNEILLDKTINLAKEKLNIQLRKLEALLIKEHINYLIINEGQDETTLLGLFPHKTVAVQSGLGWIGRNSLLITEEYGPRVRIATVLLGIESNHENILMENKCGECTKCLTACPYNCIIGRSWYEGISRDKMIDAFKCSKIREGFTDKIGHKHACGYCLLVCPYGDQ